MLINGVSFISYNTGEKIQLQQSTNKVTITTSIIDLS